MAPRIDRLFTSQVRRRISEAVGEAERRTSGEIVPYVAEASDGYEVATWRGAVLGALLGAALAAAGHELGAFWGPVSVWIALPPLAGAAAGLLASLAPPLRRALAGRELLERRVRRRAVRAFLEEEVFRTRERTGILLFVSLFERRVVVLGDRGINARVEEEEWAGLAGRLAAGVRADHLPEALIEAIGACGRLLEAHGLAVPRGDLDELPDRLRTGGTE